MNGFATRLPDVNNLTRLVRDVARRTSVRESGSRGRDFAHHNF